MDELLNELNSQQLNAVKSEDQHVLILAGAGTGKTRAITARIAWLVKQAGIDPNSILAVTFTNKAAGEMKERVAGLIGEDVPVTIKTFHSFGAYLLRRTADILGRTPGYQIYDDDDAKKLLGTLLKKNDIARSELGRIHFWIRTYKRHGEKIEAMEMKSEQLLHLYNEYNRALVEYNCFDLEDLILRPLQVLRDNPAVMERYRDRYRYIMIDEYQDTNAGQYNMVRHLCGPDTRLMVVGDEDQSIYRFRGADIQNILNFQQDFPGATVIRLEQNYRSSGCILEAANAVIKNNTMRLGKNLFTESGDGNRVVLFSAYHEREEAEIIIDLVEESQIPLDEQAVLYRTNNQSRVFEQVLNRRKIPFEIIGAMKFFDREEVRDSVSLLRWLVNPRDRISFERFVNKPARGIGAKSLDRFMEAARSLYGSDLFEAIQNVISMKKIEKRAREGLFNVGKTVKNRDVEIADMPMDQLLQRYLQELGIWGYYEERDEKNGTDKLSNIRELISSLKERGSGREAILSYLEEVGLSANMYQLAGENSGRLKLLTVHNAKGLEFDTVFICGLEEGLFPHANSIETEEEAEEERRLFYVGITRARKNLHLSYCRNRTLYGSYRDQYPSPLLEEIPEEFIEKTTF
jgi:DNA helicase-2/ATP-dependent DNA helicase PcrA